MIEDLLKPSFGGGAIQPSKSYDIGRLVIVAFFGGFISMGIIGTINGRWLKLDKKILILLGALGVILVAAKLVLLYLIASGQVAMENKMFRQIDRIGYVLYFAAYYLALRAPFRLFAATGGQPLPLLKPAILWILVGGAIESLMVLGLSWGMDYDLF